MIHNILIACDKFKGSLSSSEVNHTLKEAFLQKMPHLSLQTLSVADGGEGLISALQQELPLKIISVTCRDPLGRFRSAQLAQNTRTGAIYIESSDATGLHLLSPQEYHPLLTDTAGVGDLILAACKLNASHIYLGLGSSATVDGGIGCMSALGYRFLDAQGQDLPGKAIDLGQVVCILRPEQNLPPISLISDVVNPVVGIRGGVRVYSPQKGASEEMVDVLEVSMTHWLQVLENNRLNPDPAGLAALPGGGAAGGLGLALLALTGAAFEPGSAWILKQLNFYQKMSAVDLVITGEGRFDDTSLEGKITGEILHQARQLQCPVILICGNNQWSLAPAGIQAIYALNAYNLLPAEYPERDPELSKKIIRRIAEELCDLWEKS